MVGFRSFPFRRGMVRWWLPRFIFDVQIRLLDELVGVVGFVLKSSFLLWYVVGAFHQLVFCVDTLDEVRYGFPF